MDDASAVEKEMKRLVEDDGNLVMAVFHSYGGLVGSQAIDEELSHAWRKARGLPGGVIHLFFCCAFVLQEGQSVLETFGKSKISKARVRHTKNSHRLKLMYNE